MNKREVTDWFEKKMRVVWSGDYLGIDLDDEWSILCGPRIMTIFRGEFEIANLPYRTIVNLKTNINYVIISLPNKVILRVPRR